MKILDILKKNPILVLTVECVLLMLTIATIILFLFCNDAVLLGVIDVALVLEFALSYFLLISYSRNRVSVKSALLSLLFGLLTAGAGVIAATLTICFSVCLQYIYTPYAVYIGTAYLFIAYLAVNAFLVKYTGRNLDCTRQFSKTFSVITAVLLCLAVIAPTAVVGALAIKDFALSNGKSVVYADFSTNKGEIKRMHCVNNGPINNTTLGTSNMKLFEEAGFPLVRTHDSTLSKLNDGSEIMDVRLIFKDFDADENDESSYNFESTDKYIMDVLATGCEVFYRLGSTIESYEPKVGNYPPADFDKWARICEHIIRHYNEGWCNGYYFNIVYWEIWNEPDGGVNWLGTNEEFFDFYVKASKHLKSCFPNLKIGGASFSSVLVSSYNDKFFKAINKAGVKLDFFSFHQYDASPEWLKSIAKAAEACLKRYDQTQAELFFAEWNYDLIRDESTVYTIKGIKGASYAMAMMCTGQNTALDAMMYYDARLSTIYNGLFDSDVPSVPLKSYYAFKMFNSLYRAGTQTESKSNNGDIYTCAASGEDGDYLLFTYYKDELTSKTMQTTIDVSGLDDDIAYAEIYYLDDTRDMQLVKTEKVEGNRFKLKLDIATFTSCLIRFTK